MVPSLLRDQEDLLGEPSGKGALAIIESFKRYGMLSQKLGCLPPKMDGENIEKHY